MGNQSTSANAVWRAVFEYSLNNRSRVLAAAGAMLAIIALLDVGWVHTAAMGYLYLIPLVIAAGFLKRWQIVLAAVVTAVLREAGSARPWSHEWVTRITLVAATFAATSLFVKELVHNAKVARDRVVELKRRQELERQLLHSQRLEAVGRLAGGIAHEFNNLLSVIIGFSDLALRRLEPANGAIRDIEHVRHAAQRAAELTRQLLEFSRRDVLKHEVLDLNAVVRNLSEMLHRLIGEDIDLQLSLQPDISRVKADSASLEQVIVNLVVNARDAMPLGGTLAIRTGEVELDGHSSGAPAAIKPGRYVTLAVSDDGVGMERNVQEHLYEPFFTTKEVGKGTGLGLAAVYGIVKQSGGEIGYLTAKGEGTTFTVFLPPTDDMPASTEPASHPSSHASHASVLLVEDDDTVRELAREILTRNGLTVSDARTPGEAITASRLCPCPVDLLLTDVILPEMNGPDLAAKLREKWPSLPVLFMTGFAALPNSAKLAGMSLIHKPISEDSLMKGVWAVLG
jgi:two-component system, cell cycle sensor histidine kinase and response regulator CckA